MSKSPVERRRELRRAISTEVSVIGADDEFFTLETRTVDISANGAAVLMDRFVLLETLVELTAKAPPFSPSFTVWARVQSNRTDQVTGKPVIGLEYLSKVQYPDHSLKYWGS